MGEDFGLDDTVGKQTVEQDDLPIDEEKDMEIKFKKVTSTAHEESFVLFTHFWLTHKLW